MPTPTCEIQPMEHRYRGIGSGNIGTGEPGNIGTGEPGNIGTGEHRYRGT